MNLLQTSSEDAGPSPQARTTKGPTEESASAWTPSLPPVTTSFSKEEEEEEEGDKIMAELQVCGPGDCLWLPALPTWDSGCVCHRFIS